MRIGIVTPTFNSDKFLRETLESVLSQAGPFELHYHVQDGGSTDRTLKILSEFEKRCDSNEFSNLRLGTRFTWATSIDLGMYDAIAKGFSKVDGEVMAWLNSDDIYLPGILKNVSEVFEHLAEVEWLKGITNYIAENSDEIINGRAYLYDREWIRAGVYGLEAHFIQQDSVFWRRSLWRRSGGLDPDLRLAGDFSLWIKFAREAELYTYPRPASCFRRVEGQLSQNFYKYTLEARKVLGLERKERNVISIFFRIARRLPDFLAQMLYLGFGRPPVGVIEWRGDRPQIYRSRRFSINLAASQNTSTTKRTFVLK